MKKKRQIKRPERLVYYKKGNEDVDFRWIAITVVALLNTDGGSIVIVDTYQEIDYSEYDVFFRHLHYYFKECISNYEPKLVSIGYSCTDVDETIFMHENLGELFLIKIVVEKSNIVHSFIPFEYDEEESFYFRKSHRNIRLNEHDAHLQRLIDYGIKRFSTDVINGHEHHKIGDYPSGKYYYKYMSLESALLCMRFSSIRFAEPPSWPDQYEGRFYGATIRGNLSSVDNPPLLACCFTHKRDNEAAWKIYSYDKKGLDSRCVEFKIHRGNLRSQILTALRTDPLRDKYTLFEGTVTYKEEDYIKKLHLPSSPDHSVFFSNFSLEKYLSLLLLKRDAFFHEQEVRFFLIPNDFSAYPKMSLSPVDIPINWENILEEVRIDAKCTPFEIDLLKDELNNKGCSGKPISITKQSALNPIPYDVYNQKLSLPLDIK